MQIGIDLGASKIESVVLSDDGKEHLREREHTPQSYNCLLYTSPSPRA